LNTPAFVASGCTTCGNIRLSADSARRVTGLRQGTDGSLDLSVSGTLPQWLFLQDFQTVSQRKKKR
jgi:hypothetical protein